MNKKDVIGLASMPLQSPTYPRGPYKFFNRQYLVIRYKTDADAIRAHLPEPLEPVGDTVSVQWLDLPDGEGFGAYSAAAQIIPCTFKGEQCNFVSQMYVDNTPPLAGGREIWGYPMKYGKAVLKVEGDTLKGSLTYATQQVATGTMVYKHDAFRKDYSAEQELLARTQVTLKLIPDINGKPAIADKSFEAKRWCAAGGRDGDRRAGRARHADCRSWAMEQAACADRRGSKLQHHR